MTVRIEVFATLREYLPADQVSDTLTVELPGGAAVQDAIAARGTSAEHASMVVSRNQQPDVSAALRDGQETNVFPPLAGGC